MVDFVGYQFVCREFTSGGEPMARFQKLRAGSHLSPVHRTGLELKTSLLGTPDGTKVDGVLHGAIQGALGEVMTAASAAV